MSLVQGLPLKDNGKYSVLRQVNYDRLGVRFFMEDYPIKESSALPSLVNIVIKVSGGSRIRRRGKGRQPQGNKCDRIFPKHCMKMKEIWPGGGGGGSPPLWRSVKLSTI